MPGIDGKLDAVRTVGIGTGATYAPGTYPPVVRVGETVGRVQGGLEWLWGGGRSFHAVKASDAYDQFAQASSEARTLSRDYPGQAVVVIRTSEFSGFPGFEPDSQRYSAVVLDGPLSSEDAAHFSAVNFRSAFTPIGMPTTANRLEQVVTDEALAWDRDPGSRPIPGTRGSKLNPEGEYREYDPYAWSPVSIADEAARLVGRYDQDGDGRIAVDASAGETTRRGAEIPGIDGWEGWYTTLSIQELARVADAEGDNDGVATRGEIARAIASRFDSGVADSDVDSQLTGWEIERYNTSELTERSIGEW